MDLKFLRFFFSKQDQPVATLANDQRFLPKTVSRLPPPPYCDERETPYCDERGTSSNINILDALRQTKKNIHEKVRCPICFENYSNERLKTTIQCKCSMEICSVCVNVINSKDKPTCPQCRSCGTGVHKKLMFIVDVDSGDETSEIVDIISGLSKDLNYEVPKVIAKKHVSYKKHKMKKLSRKKKKIKIFKFYKKESIGSKEAFKCECGYTCRKLGTMVGHVFTTHYEIEFEK